MALTRDTFTDYQRTWNLSGARRERTRRGITYRQQQDEALIAGEMGEIRACEANMAQLAQAHTLAPELDIAPLQQTWETRLQAAVDAVFA